MTSKKIEPIYPGDEEPELLKAKKLLDLPRIEAPIIWVSGYYDGPLNGACWIEGEGLCWFERDSSLEEPARRFLIYRLTNDEFRTLTERHLAFEMYVGTHYCYHAKGAVKDRNSHSLFYDNYSQRDDYVGDKEPIGKLIRK